MSESDDEVVMAPKENIDSEKLKEELRADIEDSDSSESEPEDEYGNLLTEDVEQGLQNVLHAIKTGDKKLFDPNVKFFKNSEDSSKDTESKETKKQKPLYLSDYKRIALLESKNEQDDEDDGTKQKNEDDDDAPEKPYTQQQKEDKEALLSAVKNTLSDDNDDDDELILKKKEDKTEDKEDLALPDPSKDGEKFLETFMEKHAWIPTKDSKNPTQNMQEDDAEFDNAAEKFENAYNFRFEDPNAAEIVSYARSQATMRRKKLSGRQKERKNEQARKRKEKQEVQKKLKQKKVKKINQVMDRIKEVREAVGEEVPESVIAEVFGKALMEDDFDPDEWDKKMTEVFDRYDSESNKPIEKPNVMEEEEEEEISKRSEKRETKHKKKEKREKIKELASKLVENEAANMISEIQEERGRTKEQEPVKFRYREVSPESFGLTTRDILFADNKDLNEYVGLKHLAPYRSKMQKEKDDAKYNKKMRLRKWRKEVFNSEEGPDTEEVKIPSIVTGSNKRHRHSHKKSHHKHNHDGTEHKSKKKHI